MTTDDKLQNFYEASLENAREEARRLIEEKKAAIDKLLEEHKAIKDRQAAAELKAETENITRENNKVISAKQLEIKKHYSELREKLRSQLFAELEEKINQYKASDEYLSYLKTSIKNALDYAGDDDISIYVDASDEALIPALSKTAGMKVSIAATSITGGIRAEIPSRNILIDNSFLSRIKDVKENFTFSPDIDGGLTL